MVERGGRSRCWWIEGRRWDCWALGKGWIGIVCRFLVKKICSNRVICLKVFYTKTEMTPPDEVLSIKSQIPLSHLQQKEIFQRVVCSGVSSSKRGQS